MTNFRDLLTNESDIAVFPDPQTADDLRKLRKFWNESDAKSATDEPDLSALSDAEIAEQLEALGVTDTGIPTQIRDLGNAPRISQPWKRGLAIAACLAGGVAIGVFGTANRGGNSTSTASDQVVVSGPQNRDAQAFDPYLLQPDVPRPQLVQPNESNLDIRTVRSPSPEERLDLNRVELRELQMLLNRFDFGPVAQLGLPSTGTNRAIALFRQTHDLAEGGADRIVLGILRELAREEALQNLKNQTNAHQQPKGETP